jgi:hypothetical protein
VQAAAAQTTGFGEAEQAPAPGHQRVGVGPGGQQPPAVTQGQEQVQGRPLVRLIASYSAHQQVAGGIEVVGIRSRTGPGVAVPVVAQPPDHQRHVPPGRTAGWQLVEQRGRYRDGLVTVGADRANRGGIVAIQPRGRPGEPLVEQAGEQGTRLGNLRGPPAGLRDAHHGGQGRAGLLDRRVQILVRARRALSQIAHDRSSRRLAR